MKSGKYQVKAKGHGSESMPMEVDIDGDKVTSIKVDSSGETKGVADEVFRRLPKTIVENQTLNVDAVSGATISSHGVIDGVRSEEHTSELQSRFDLVCRLLL